MKYSVTTVMLPNLDVLETCALLQRLGYDGVEWRIRDTAAEARGKGYSFWGEHKSDLSPANLPERAKEVSAITGDHGLEIAAIAADVRADDLETIKKLAEGIARLGKIPIKIATPSWYSRQDHYQSLYEEAIEAYERSLEVLRPYGLKALVETHNNTIVVSASLAHRIVSQFSPDQIGVIYDINNMASDGFETFRIGMELLGAYLQHCHVAGQKPVFQRRSPDGGSCWDFETCDLSDGVLDIRQFLIDLKSVGYKGFISVEDFRTQDPEETLRTQIEYLRTVEASLE